MADEPQPQEGDELIQSPSKLLRITVMVRGLLDEARQSPLDEAGRRRLRKVYERSLEEVKEVISENLQRELEALSFPLDKSPSESEIRVAQAQLVGWLEGLLHGIQAALWAQHMQARAELDQMRHRALPGGAPPGDEGRPHGQYL